MPLKHLLLSDWLRTSVSVSDAFLNGSDWPKRSCELQGHDRKWHYCHLSWCPKLFWWMRWVSNCIDEWAAILDPAAWYSILKSWFQKACQVRTCRLTEICLRIRENNLKNNSWFLFKAGTVQWDCWYTWPISLRHMERLAKGTMPSQRWQVCCSRSPPTWKASISLATGRPLNSAGAISADGSVNTLPCVPQEKTIIRLDKMLTLTWPIPIAAPDLSFISEACLCWLKASKIPSFSHSYIQRNVRRLLWKPPNRLARLPWRPPICT